MNEGQQPYTPSRVEWLAIILNSMSVSVNIVGNRSPNAEVFVSYAPDPKRNTIRINLEHTENFKSETVNEIMQKLRNQVLYVARSLGWNLWLKIEENIQVIEG